MKPSGTTGKIDLKPTYAGSWVIGKNFHICVSKRPSWVARFFTKLLLQWEWQDHI